MTVVIGGPHHGERHSIEYRRPGGHLRLPILERLPLSMVEDAPLEAVRAKTKDYRLCVITGARGKHRLFYWVPVEISEDDDAAHLLMMAARPLRDAEQMLRDQNLGTVSTEKVVGTDGENDKQNQTPK